MRSTYLGLALATMMIASPAVLSADEPATTQAVTRAAPKEVTDTIDKAIALLEAGKTKEAVQLLFDPATLAGKDFDKAMQKKPSYSSTLLKALKETKTTTPKVTDTSVVYPLKEKHQEVRFEKVKDHWYLQ